LSQAARADTAAAAADAGEQDALMMTGNDFARC